MTFTPDRIAISNITKAWPGVVTTEEDHNLTTGQVVRINVPLNYGMFELNKTLSNISILDSTRFSLYTQVHPKEPIDTTGFTTFTIPSNPSFTAEVLPVGAGPTPILSPSVYLTKEITMALIDDATTNIAT